MEKKMVSKAVVGELIDGGLVDELLVVEELEDRKVPESLETIYLLD